MLTVCLSMIKEYQDVSKLSFLADTNYNISPATEVP